MARYNGNTIQTTNRNKNNKTTGTGNNRGGTKAGGSINGALTGAVFGSGAPGSRADPPVGARERSLRLRAIRPYRWGVLPA